MRIFHDHPCEPFETPHSPLATTFTYDCRCGRLMIVENCRVDDPIAFGYEYYMTLPTGEKVKPTGYVEV